MLAEFRPFQQGAEFLHHQQLWDRSASVFQASTSARTVIIIIIIIIIINFFDLIRILNLFDICVI